MLQYLSFVKTRLDNSSIQYTVVVEVVVEVTSIVVNPVGRAEQRSVNERKFMKTNERKN